ncbi:hypothetical protein BFF93_13165 [Elizabethkingia meningoseptica]|nr:hypothetical protein BES09_13160 [Elizabethkingia meningoseptica]OHT27490.1 hypothetical protein BFF93_13165 [Elizabethkingia meningoseptica]OPC12742.1 hypothetical protein BAX93_03170 [Elizabethkingia meningoseptica]
MVNSINPDEYRTRLTNSFPKELENDVNEVFKILSIEYEIITSENQILVIHNLIHSGFQEVKYNYEILKIPHRLYFNEPSKKDEDILSTTQKTILNCIFLRHFNGYIRERRLKNLIQNTEAWVIPFIFQLIGEYVYEIFETLSEHITENTHQSYINFANQNPEYFQLTKNRVISYWDAYYRRKYPKLNQYLAYKIINKIKDI